MVSKQRARTGADKLARRMQILEGALGLWEEKGYEALTMSMVAERLQLAKGTLYLYFPTKEELFLAIYIQLLDEWFHAAEVDVQDLRPASATLVSRTMVSLLTDRPKLARLIPLVSSVLERNTGEQAARNYREWYLRHVTSLGEIIEETLDGLAPGTGNDCLVYFFALAAGLQPMSDPTEALKPLVEDPAMLALKVEFGPALQHGFAVMLTGYQRFKL